MTDSYEVIVVGARAAGAATAMLLARAGLRVLVVDRAGFPSDTLSTHQVQLPGIARLNRWGLLDRVVASGAPATRRVRFQRDGIVLDGHYPGFDGVDAMYSPRRTVLDAILLEAAREAGAEVRQRFAVEEVIADNGRVTGIRRTGKGSGRTVTEHARLVVGADGKHSLVARAVQAPIYRHAPALSMCSYSYWDGVPITGGEIYLYDRRVVTAWPTNDGLVMAAVLWPIEEFGRFRADVNAAVTATFAGAGELGEQLRAGRRVERYRTTPDLPNAIRQPFGPGWALAGDAGLVMDPITAQGIGNALRDAELLSEAIIDGLGGGRSLESALPGYQRARDAATGPMYGFTIRLASFAPASRRERMMLAALQGRPAEIERFLGMLAGTVPVRAYFAARNVARALGVRGLAALVGHRPPSGRPTSAPQAQPTG